MEETVELGLDSASEASAGSGEAVVPSQGSSAPDSTVTVIRKK
jgi:hypothetical protein